MNISDEDADWARDIMSDVLAARAVLETVKRPRGTLSNPALSCRDLRTAHSDFSDGMYGGELRY